MTLEEMLKMYARVAESNLHTPHVSALMVIRDAIARESEREKEAAVKELVEAAQELVNVIHEDMKSTGPFKVTPSMALKQALMGARALLSKHSPKGEGASNG